MKLKFWKKDEVVVEVDPDAGRIGDINIALIMAYHEEAWKIQAAQDATETLKVLLDDQWVGSLLNDANHVFSPEIEKQIEKLKKEASYTYKMPSSEIWFPSYAPPRTEVFYPPKIHTGRDYPCMALTLDGTIFYQCIFDANGKDGPHKGPHARSDGKEWVDLPTGPPPIIVYEDMSINMAEADGDTVLDFENYVLEKLNAEAERLANRHKKAYARISKALRK